MGLSADGAQRGMENIPRSVNACRRRQGLLVREIYATAAARLPARQIDIFIRHYIITFLLLTAWSVKILPCTEAHTQKLAMLSLATIDIYYFNISRGMPHRVDVSWGADRYTYTAAAYRASGFDCLFTLIR